MSVGAYLRGVGGVAVIAGSLAFGADRWRRRLLPGWETPVGTLADVVVASGALCVIAELLGAAGAFSGATVVVASAFIGVGVGLAARRSRAAGGPLTPRQTDYGRSLYVMGAAVGLLGAQWLAWTVRSLRQGITEADSIIYHLPHAARWVQLGSLSHLQYVTTQDVTAFHPSNGEVFHAIGISLFGADFVSPLFNLAFLAILLLAAWSFVPPGRARPLGVVVVSVVVASPLVARTQPGSAQTDVVALAFFVASLAFLRNADGSRTSVAVAGFAAGLALGSKLTMVVPVGALTAAVAVLAPNLGYRRVSALAVWSASAFTGGAFWFIRNLARTGSPVPTLRVHIGPIALPHPRLELIDRFGFNVAHYLRDPHAWTATFKPGLRLAFGPLWPVTLLFVAGAAGAAILRRPSAFAVTLAAIAGVAALGYLVTPTTAYGPPGHPQLEFFFPNLRYLLPALVLALLAVPETLGDRRLHSGVIAVGALLVGTSAFSAGAWPTTALRSIGAGMAAVAGATVVVWLSRRAMPTRPVRHFVAAAGAAIALAAGYPTASLYLRHRYTAGPGADARSQAFAWAQHVHDKRIGITGFFLNYPLYGRHLSNRVSYIGVVRRDHSFDDYKTCEAWRAAVNRGRFDYVVTMPAFTAVPEPAAATWIATAGAVPVFRSNGVTVARIDHPLSVSCQ